MSPRVSSQPIQIPEIPPFRKQAHSTMHSPVSQSPQNLGLVNASPPRIAEIPPFRPRIRSKEWMPNIEVSRMKVSSQQTNPAVLTCVDLHSFFSSFFVSLVNFIILFETKKNQQLHKKNQNWNKSTPNIISRSGPVEAPSGRNVWRRPILPLFTEAPTVL